MQPTRRLSFRLPGFFHPVRPAGWFILLAALASWSMTASGAAVWEQGSWGSWGEDVQGSDTYLCDSEHGNLVRGVHGY